MEFQQLVAVMPWTIILQIGNLLLTIWLFKKFLLKPVQNILRQRQEQVETDLNTAEQAKREAELAKQQYAQNLEHAKDEAAAMVRSAAHTAQTRGEQIILEAKQEAAAIRAKASEEIAQQRKSVVNEMKNDLSELAVTIASKVVEKEVSEKDHEKLIEAFIDQMGDAV